MLEGVVQRGTAAQAADRSAGRSAARPAPPTTSAAPGSSASRPHIVVGVFVGFDDNRSLGKGETGAVAAVPIFIDFMQEALKGTAAAGLQGAAGHQVRHGRSATARPSSPAPSPSPTVVAAAVDRSTTSLSTSRRSRRRRPAAPRRRTAGGPRRSIRPPDADRRAALIAPSPAFSYLARPLTHPVTRRLS